MITERHNIACRLIMKALSKASLGACIVSMDIGSKDRLAQQNLSTPEHTSNRMVPKWLLPPNLSDRNRLTCSRPDAIFVTAKPLNTPSALPQKVPSGQKGRNGTRKTLPLATNNKPLRPHEISKIRRHIHLLEVKFCEDTRPAPQLEASRLQHRDLCKHLQGAQVTLHSVLLYPIWLYLTLRLNSEGKRARTT